MTFCSMYLLQINHTHFLICTPQNFAPLLFFFPPFAFLGLKDCGPIFRKPDGPCGSALLEAICPAMCETCPIPCDEDEVCDFGSGICFAPMGSSGNTHICVNAEEESNDCKEPFQKCVKGQIPVTTTATTATTTTITTTTEDVCDPTTVCKFGEGICYLPSLEVCTEYAEVPASVQMGLSNASMVCHPRQRLPPRPLLRQPPYQPPQPPFSKIHAILIVYALKEALAFAMRQSTNCVHNIQKGQRYVERDL